MLLKGVRHGGSRLYRIVGSNASEVHTWRSMRTLPSRQYQLADGYSFALTSSSGSSHRSSKHYATTAGATAANSVASNSNPAATASSHGTAAGGRFRGDDEIACEPIWGEVDAYVLSHLQPGTAAGDEALRWALENAAAQNLPDISVCPTLGKFLSVQLRALGARQVLEVGTLGAYSTLWMASGNANVRVTTLENNAVHAAVSRQNIAHAGLADRVDVLEGNAVDSLQQLLAEVETGARPRFDFVFIDADKVNNYRYFDLGVRLAHPGSMLVVDNVVRQGKLVDAEAAKTALHISGARELVERVGTDPRVEATVLQLVSEKTYDGILVATVL